MTTTPSTTRYNAVAIFVAGVLATLALAVGVGADLLADSQAPVTKLLVAECQRFDALATAGGRAMTCAADPVVDDVNADGNVSAPRPAPTVAVPSKV